MNRAAAAPSTIRVGSLSVQPILDGVAILEPAMFTVDGEPADWSGHRELLDADGRLVLPVGVFVVRSGDRIVMIDAGVGVTDDPMFHGHALLDNLGPAGVAVTDIDAIVVTHLHNDHCGWLHVDGVPTFPNAAVYVGAADWAFFVDEAGGGRRRAARLAQITDRVELIGDGATVAPGITTRATPGHTPGHTSVVISSGDERLLVLGDAIHCPAQLTESEWQFLYDVDKGLASRTRAELLAEAEVPGTTILPAHFPGLQAARLLPASGQRRWVMSGAG